jgi:hypothetical protein
MTTTPYYRDEILAKILPGLEHDIFCLLRGYIGKEHAISLDALTLEIFGNAAIVVDENGNESINVTRLRQVRESIETLREVYGVPVCSNSGKAGRYLPKDRVELDEFIAEHRSRAAKETQAADKLERAARTWDFTKPVEHIPAGFEQMTFIPEATRYA